MSEIIVVLCTIPPDVAESLARLLVEKKVAACVNIVPGARSIYRWEGRVAEDEESVLVIKTTAGRFAELCALIKSSHPYTVPEIIALPASDGNPDYLAWVRESVEPEP